MSNDSPDAVYFPREIDYLEDLGAKLRNLQGFATLAHELVQNADDVPNVSAFTFNICQDGLIIENDGRFSDCNQLQKSECPWKDDPANGSHRCDFHRFRLVAGADKRNEAGTTGAFGIGFISVYQITDRPELISGRHWIIDESEEPSRRIAECRKPDCPDCRTPGLPGTRFFLPWASNPNSVLRQKLRAEPTINDTPEKLLSELERSLPTAMLFLKKLSTVEIKQNGRLLRRLQREKIGDTLLVTDGHTATDRIWHLIRGEFSTQSEKLRTLHPNRIERKRSSEVVIAIPESSLESGLLCATLPTQQRTGLPFHLNADFYPSEDRKRIILEQDFQSQWNRAAIGAGASALASSLDKLPMLLGHERLWALLARVQQVGADSAEGRNEGVFSTFWADLAPSLTSANIIFTNRMKWCKPTEVFYLQQESEKPALPVLEEIGLNFVHENLRPYQNLFTAAPLSVRTLTVQHIADALKQQGLTKYFSKSSWPPFLQQPAALRSLWEEINLLVNRRRALQLHQHHLHNASITSLSPLALAVSRDGALCPCNSVYRAENSETERLFLKLNPAIPFASGETSAFPLFGHLCPSFGPAQAIGELQKLGAAGFGNAVAAGKVSVARLISWFADHRPQILHDANLKTALAALPIYPSAGAFQPLNALSLPGNFSDPLQLAAVLDVGLLPNQHEFLREVGIQELSFPVYVSQHLIPALCRADLPAQKRRDAALLLASRRSEISEAEDIRKALSCVPLIECVDGQFHVAEKVYFQSKIVSEVLAATVAQTSLPADHEALFRELFLWLGVAENPRFDDIVARIKTLADSPPSIQAVASIRIIFGHLASRLQTGENPSSLNFLQTYAWLPARKQSTRWFKPVEIYAAFQDYLFDSQATFLDIDRSTQNGATVFLEFLGIKSTPSVSLVVTHLLHCAGETTRVNEQVYSFLNNNAADPIVGQLRNQRCLLLPEGNYIEPSGVFWSEHQFGPFRKRLGQELRKYNDLFQRLGIRETPTHQDAFLVLSEISTEFGTRNTSLDSDAYAVVMACWRMLENALEQNTIGASDLAILKVAKCVPNSDHVLNPPSWMFFEDRAGLASKFEGFLKTNAIARPLGASKAMAAAGVRTLATAVEIQLLECRNASEHPALAQRVQERRLQLARVLDAQSAQANPNDKLAELDLIRFESAELLSISYRLEAFGKSLPSTPEDCPALYRSSDKLLLFVAPEGRVPWASISRELALALYPDDEPGRIAPGLKEVLSADTLAEAKAVLDELGFSTLESAPAAPAAGTETVGTLGGTTTPPETPATQPPGLTPDQAVAALLGAGATPPTPPPTDLNKPEIPLGSPAGGTGTNTGGGSPSGGATGGNGNMPRPRAPRRGKLRSYVVRDTRPQEGESDPEKAAERSAVAEAGIAKVVAFEEAEPNKRHPKVMPTNHPGYDIESCHASGEIARYIEVKSLSGLWGADGVGLTSTEFSKARELGDLYWLYVVEKAEQPDARIYCIQDPARKVDQFLYDAGWQDTSTPGAGA